MEFQDRQDFSVIETNQIIVKKQKNAVLLGTLQDAILLCSPSEVDMDRKINLESVPLCLEIQKELDKLCEEYKISSPYTKVA